MKALVREIFCSAQGEGPYVGVRQVFVRFEGCNFACPYCDTPLKKTKDCKVEAKPGSGEFITVKNPISAEELSSLLKKFANIHSISLTGGEPLIYADFIRLLDTKEPLYLETNMSLPKEALKIEGKIKYVAGDFKLRQAHTSTHYEKYLEDMAECFSIFRKTKDRDCFCKVVLVKGFDKTDVLEGIAMIEDYISTVILQPVTPIKGLRPPSPREILDLQEKLSHLDARIIPQAHVIWGGF
jgi:organic radical activating enzyme